jgi:biopolymer transport protein ExbD
VDVTLPTADSAVQTARTQGEIYINIRQDGQIILNNRPMTLPELQEVLNRVAELFPGGAVIIRGDKGAALGQAIAVLDCCRKADIQNVSFAAVSEDAANATR